MLKAAIYKEENDLKIDINTLRTGDADLRLYAYKQFKYPVPNVLRNIMQGFIQKFLD
jgi:hypothetical protein